MVKKSEDNDYSF